MQQKVIIKFLNKIFIIIILLLFVYNCKNKYYFATYKEYNLEEINKSIDTKDLYYIFNNDLQSYFVYSYINIIKEKYYYLDSSYNCCKDSLIEISIHGCKDTIKIIEKKFINDTLKISYSHAFIDFTWHDSYFSINMLDTILSIRNINRKHCCFVYKKDTIYYINGLYRKAYLFGFNNPYQNINGDAVFISGRSCLNNKKYDENMFIFDKELLIPLYERYKNLNNEILITKLTSLKTTKNKRKQNKLISSYEVKNLSDTIKFTDYRKINYINIKETIFLKN